MEVVPTARFGDLPECYNRRLFLLLKGLQMAASKNKLDSDQKEPEEWTKLIEGALESVDKQLDSYSKMQTLYDQWRAAQTKERNAWRYSKEDAVEWQEVLGGDGEGYIPVSQFAEWTDTFKNNEMLRKIMLETFIPTYIIPDPKKYETSDEKIERAIWDEYHEQPEQRILIISREPGLYDSKKRSGGPDGIPYWTIWEAYSQGAIGEKHKVIEGLIGKFDVTPEFRSKYPLESQPSLSNAWLRRVSRKERSSGETAARYVLQTAYLMNAKVGSSRKARALKLLQDFYPKTLKEFNPTEYEDEEARYKAAYDLVKDIQNIEEGKKNGETRRNNWAEEYTANIAYMVVNKRGGASNTDYSKGHNVVKGYLERYGDLLLKEISLYDPTEIVVYGLEIWEWLKDRAGDLFFEWNKELVAENRQKHEVDVYGLPHWSGRNKAAGAPKGVYLYQADLLIRPKRPFSFNLADKNLHLRS